MIHPTKQSRGLMSKVEQGDKVRSEAEQGCGVMSELLFMSDHY